MPLTFQLRIFKVGWVLDFERVISSVLSPAKTEAMFEAILLFGYAVVPLTGVFPEVFS